MQLPLSQGRTYIKTRVGVMYIQIEIYNEGFKDRQSIKVVINIRINIKLRSGEKKVQKLQFCAKNERADFRRKKCRTFEE